MFIFSNNWRVKEKMKKAEITQFNNIGKKHKLLCIKIKKQLELIHKSFCKVNRMAVGMGDFKDSILDDFEFTKTSCIYKTRCRYDDEPDINRDPIELMFLDFEELIIYHKKGLEEYKLKEEKRLKEYQEKNKDIIEKNELKQYKKLHKKYGKKK